MLAPAAAVAVVLSAVAAVPVAMAFVLVRRWPARTRGGQRAGRRLALPPRVQALVQAESLFNDGTSLVLFQIAVSFAVGSSVAAGWGSVLWHGTVQFVALAGAARWSAR